jgi:hypothetical protein
MTTLGYALNMLLQLSIFALLDTSNCSIVFNELASHSPPGVHGNIVCKSENQGQIDGPTVKEENVSLYSSNVRQVCPQASSKTNIIVGEDNKAIEMGEG